MDSLFVLATAAAEAPRSEVPVPEFTIRKAREEDLPLLGPVENSASQVFRTVNLDHIANGPTLPNPQLSAMSNSNHLWVAVNTLDQPVGFVGGEEVDGSFYIVEISVAQHFQGKGAGKALMAAMEQQIRKESFKDITLTTYKHLPWNGPWYAKRGYSDVQVDELGEGHMKIWEHEGEWHDMNLRCAMRKVL